jgi:hypothetical protein
MPSAVDLIELPFTFWQLPLLTEEQFRREAEERGVRLQPLHLEGLHRLRLLTPFLRVKRDGRAIAGMARRGDPFLWEAAHSHPVGRADLEQAKNEGALHDPTAEPFVARRRLQRTAGETTYMASEYLYSHHQLIGLRVVDSALSHLRYGPGPTITGLDVHHFHRERWKLQAAQLHSLAIVLSALEPIYYPAIVRRISYVGPDYDAYKEWLARLPVTSTLKWLNLEPAWLRSTAEGLLEQARWIDPSGKWAALLPEADPEQWRELKGEARMAVDLRVAAELPLRYYEHLASARRAPAIRPPRLREPDPLQYRLRPQGGLDGLLMQFGLSPHPRLLLVLEGETEMTIFPRVLDYFGIRRDRDFIALENARGVDRDLSPLVAYAIAPKTVQEEGGRYLRLIAPPTRMLAMMDAEGSYLSEERREKRRSDWVDRIMLTLDTPIRTPAIRRAIERLVHVETWNARGESFEFAHFTDRQLARAAARLDRRSRQPNAEDRQRIIGQLRAKQGNLKHVLGRVSKVELAEELWPTLERKIERAKARNTERRIPIVRALDLAIDLARELPRKNLVMLLHEE